MEVNSKKTVKISVTNKKGLNTLTLVLCQNMNFRYYTENIYLKLVSQPVSIIASNPESILPVALFYRTLRPFLRKYHVRFSVKILN